MTIAHPFDSSSAFSQTVIVCLYELWYCSKFRWATKNIHNFTTFVGE